MEIQKPEPSEIEEDIEVSQESQIQKTDTRNVVEIKLPGGSGIYIGSDLNLEQVAGFVLMFKREFFDYNGSKDKSYFG